MAGTKYLTLQDVCVLHDVVLERTHSRPAELLFPDRLESAIQRPQWIAHYEGADLVRQAIILAVAISQAQAFADGNKRTGFACASSFLRRNGIAFRGEPLEFANHLEEVALVSQGEARDAQQKVFEGWLRANIMSLPDPPEELTSGKA